MCMKVYVLGNCLLCSISLVLCYVFTYVSRNWKYLKWYIPVFYISSWFFSSLKNCNGRRDFGCVGKNQSEPCTDVLVWLVFNPHPPDVFSVGWLRRGRVNCKSRSFMAVIKSKACSIRSYSECFCTPMNHVDVTKDNHWGIILHVRDYTLTQENNASDWCEYICCEASLIDSAFLSTIYIGGLIVRLKNRPGLKAKKIGAL